MEGQTNIWTSRWTNDQTIHGYELGQEKAKQMKKGECENRGVSLDNVMACISKALHRRTIL